MTKIKFGIFIYIIKVEGRRGRSRVCEGGRPQNYNNQVTFLFVFVAIYIKTTFFFNFKIYIYSVTQSYANSFRGDVLDSFNNVTRDEDNILDQIYI